MAIGRTNFPPINDANLVAGNIKDGVTILGVTGNYVGGAGSFGSIQTLNNTDDNGNEVNIYYYISTDGKIILIDHAEWVNGGYGSMFIGGIAGVNTANKICTLLSKTYSSRVISSVEYPRFSATSDSFLNWDATNDEWQRQYDLSQEALLAIITT